MLYPRSPIRDFFLGSAVALFFSAQVHAEATVVYLKGDVRDDGVPVTLGRRILPGTTLITGSGAQAYLRFSDQQQIVLDQDTAFRIADFRYIEDEAQGDRATFDLLRGAARFISGVIGARNPGAVVLRTPQATFSVRGTDFMVALANWTFLKVQYGAVGVTNLAGTVVFGANTAAAVTSVSAIAQPVFADALPPAASGPFASLAVAPTGAAVTQAAASEAAGATTSEAPAPTTGAGTAVTIGLGAAVAAVALKGSSAATHH